MRGLRYTEIEVVRYRDDVADEFGHKSRAEVERYTTWAQVQQGASVERNGNTVTTAAVFMNPKDVVNAGDEIEIDGARYEIDGQPVFPRNARGVHHIEVQARYVGLVDPTPAGA